jgi:hypothetical protein
MATSKNASHNIAYLYEACDQIDSCQNSCLEKCDEKCAFMLNVYKSHIFRHIFLSNYWWQESDIWSQASYRYPISWEAFLDPSDSYFLFADLVGFYTKNASHDMGYLYEACDQISDSCHQ